MPVVESGEVPGGAQGAASQSQDGTLVAVTVPSLEPRTQTFGSVGDGHAPTGPTQATLVWLSRPGATSRDSHPRTMVPPDS